MNNNRENLIINSELIDERADGRIKCSILNRGFVVYKIPENMVDYCDTDEYKKTGIYFLVDSNKKLAYVGKTDGQDVITRALQKDIPHKKIEKWDYLILILDCNSGVGRLFTGDAIGYLEYLFYVKMESSVSKWKIANRKKPSYITPLQRKEYEEIVDVSIKMIYTLGFEFLVQETKLKLNEIDEKYKFFYTANGLKAELVYDKNEHKFWLLKGTDISKKIKDSIKDFDWIIRNRKSIKSSIKNNKLIKNIPFSNASRAINVAFGTNLNGLEKWKNSYGDTIKEIVQES